MKPSLMEILACPLCKNKLELKVTEGEEGVEIITGSLRCPECDITYPITEGIPRLLPSERD